MNSTERTEQTGPRTDWAVVDSAIGPLLLAATSQGLVNVVFHADATTTAKTVERLEIKHV